MTEFLRGWKRKVGVATLVMACVVCAEWLRSDEIADKVTITPTVANSFSVASDRHGISLICETQFLLLTSPSDRIKFTSSTQMFQPHPLYVGRDDRLDWRRRYWRFDLGRLRSDTKSVTALIVPHWAINAMLIMVAAWLLVGRQAWTQKSRAK